MLDRHASGAGGVNPERSQNFRNCLELLRGPSDERRFVGLLLVTRLLPHGSDEAVRQVLDALGTQFLHRLLLPLRAPPRRPASGPAGAAVAAAAAAEQQTTCCGLALAILAAACRLPDFAAGSDLRELLPVLLQVVQYGGVSHILQPAAVDAADVDAADVAAVADALECLVGAAAAAPDPTCAALEHCPALEALAAWLTAAAAALTAVPDGRTSAHSTTSDAAAVAASATIEAQKHQSVLLAAALLERLLSGGGGGGGRAAAVLAEHPAATARIMAALAALVGNPRLQLAAAVAAAAANTPGPAGSPDQNQQQSQGQGTPSRVPKDACGGGGGGAAQLQLEALHLLLLMLRACQEPAAAAAAAALVRLDECGTKSWSAAVRRGLGWLLRSRAPGPLRHSALQVAAVVVELAGEGWLLGPRDGGAAAGGCAVAAQEQPGSFLLLLAETLKIETGLLLLQDALNPDRPVPAADARRGYRALGGGAAVAADPPPAPSQRLLDELAARAAQCRATEAAAVRAAADAAGGGTGPAPAAIQPPPPSEMEMEMDEAMSSGAGAAADGGEAVAAMPPAGAATVPAGQRALELLPACFRLLEAAVGAVAADAAAADGHMDVEGSAAAAGPRQPSPLPEPVLSDVVMQKLMASFHDVISDTMVPFLESSTHHHRHQNQTPQQQQQQDPQQQQQGQLGAAAAAAGPAAAVAAAAAATGSGSGRGVPGTLLMGAARVLGRYLAEAPGAVRSGRVLKALPGVMAVRCGGGGGVGTATMKAEVPAIDGDDDDEEEEDLDSFALSFLLPGLLQATGPGADGRSETARALRDSPAAVDACVTYLAYCVRCVVEAAPRAERLMPATADSAPAGAGSRVGAGSGAAAMAVLVHSERALADVSMLLLNLLEPPVVGALTEGRRAVAAGVGAGTAPPFAWEVLRRCQVGACSAGPDQEGAAAAAAAAAQHLPPLLGRLLPVCWLVQRWAAAREASLRALLVSDPLRIFPGASQLLFRSQLGTRPLICTTTLAAVAITAIMSCLVNAGASTMLSPATTPSQQQQQQHAAAAAAGVILPATLLEAVGAAALAAAAAGAALQVAQMRDEAAAQYGAAAAATTAADSASAALPLTPKDVAEDFLGDAEVCWDRLLGSCVQMAEFSGAVRRLAAAGVVGGGGVGSATWLQRLAAAQAAGDPAAENLLLAEVKLSLLLRVVAAPAAGAAMSGF